MYSGNSQTSAHKGLPLGLAEEQASSNFVVMIGCSLQKLKVESTVHNVSAKHEVSGLSMLAKIQGKQNKLQVKICVPMDEALLKNGIEHKGSRKYIVKMKTFVLQG